MKLFFLLLLILCAAAGYGQNLHRGIPPEVKTQKLTQSGFVPMPMTSDQEGLFNTLPPNKITPIPYQGGTCYAYPDAANHQILIGQESNLQSFRALIHPRSAAAGAQPAQQGASESPNQEIIG